jgi:O-antigen/teichoic acid export membrane protein
LPTVLIGAIVGVTEAGIYKIGAAAATVVGRLADPATSALLPRIARLWAGGRRREVRRLIKRTSLVSIAVMTLVLAAVILFRSPILKLLGGGESADISGAVAVLILMGVAQAVNGALFWNIGVLYVTGRTRLMAWVYMVAAVTQIALLAPLILAFHAAGAALTFLVVMIGINIVCTHVALADLRSGDEEGTAIDPLSETRASTEEIRSEPL